LQRDAALERPANQPDQQNGKHCGLFVARNGAIGVRMLGAFSLMSIVVGAAAAAVADRFAKHAEAIETGAGVLLIGGLALLGSALPVMV
jgi:hypothetical protein